MRLFLHWPIVHKIRLTFSEWRPETECSWTKGQGRYLHRLCTWIQFKEA